MKNKIIIILIFLTAAIFTGCDPLSIPVDEPILLMNFRSSDSNVSFSNIRLIDSNDNEIELKTYESIYLQSDDGENEDEDTGYSASVTYLLEAGKSYKEIIVTAYGADHHEPITINFAENNMVYYVMIYRSE